MLGGLAAAAWGTAGYFAGSSEAALAYAQFSDAMARDDFVVAADLATGAVAEEVAARIAERPGRGYHNELEQVRARDAAQKRGASNGTTHQVVEEEEVSDDEVRIVAIRRDMRSGAGRAGIYTVRHRHQATVRRIEGRWRVATFVEEFLP